MTTLPATAQLPTTQLPTTQLPTLDLASAESDPDAFRTALREATHTYGFLYLTGHGVPQTLIDEVLGLARRFFALDDSAKDSISQLNSPHFRGYTRLGGELTGGAVDWREQIDIGPERPAVDGATGYWNLQGPNQWPAELPELEPAFTAWDTALSDVGLRLLRHWALSLGAAEDVFDASFAEAPATLIKVVRYPGNPDNPQGVGAHKDSGVLTLLLVEPNSQGLHVELDSGEWIDVPAVPGAFVVNIGEMLEYATGGYLRATRHRVLAPTPGTDRISVPYFLSPALDATMPVLTLPPELAARSRGVENDPANPIHATYGENAWKSRLRAHPDVAARHHGTAAARQHGTAAG